MARPRTELQTLLETLTPKVYFQAPPPAGMKYPCILYKHETASVAYADDIKYRHHIRYQVTAVDRDPDSELSKLISELKYCEFDRSYRADGLNHDVYNLFF